MRIHAIKHKGLLHMTCVTCAIESHSLQKDLKEFQGTTNNCRQSQRIPRNTNNPKEFLRMFPSPHLFHPARSKF